MVVIASILACIFFILQSFGLINMVEQMQKPGPAMKSLYGLTFFLVVIHALHVVGGAAGMAMVIMGIRRDKYDHERHFAVRFCALYWHFLDFVWIIMIGSVIAVRDGSHFCVDLLRHPRTPRWQAISNFIVHVAMLLLALIFVRYGYDFAQFGFKQTSEMSGINMLSIYISFPLAGLSWAVFLVEKIVGDVRRYSEHQPGGAS